MFGNHLKEQVSPEVKLHTIDEALQDLKEGRVIIVVDDEDRENEGDFICAAETVNAQIINFMSKEGRGLICAPIEAERAKELDLDMMVSSNNSFHETAFTISIDYLGKGCTTGISAHDRATAIQALVDPDTRPEDLARPGHVFPLIAKSGGVLRRTGHTEAAVDLMKLAGLSPAGVLVEILNDDGTMARLPQLLDLSKKLDLKIISIRDLVAYRMQRERIVEKVFSHPWEMRFGHFDVTAFQQTTTGDIHLALTKGTFDPGTPALVRVQSSPVSLDILSALCSEDMDNISRTLQQIEREGHGALVIMRHSDKTYKTDFLAHLKAIVTKEGPDRLPDAATLSEKERDIGVGAQIIRELGISKIRLLTNNITRPIALDGYGLEIVDYLSLKDS